MPKPKKNERLPFKRLNPQMKETQGNCTALFQIQPDKPGASAVIEVCYDPEAGPNQLANIRYNYGNLDKANPSQPAGDAIYCWFRVNKPEAVTIEEFSALSKEIISKQIVFGIVELFEKIPFKQKPTEICLYPVPQSTRYTPFMQNAAGLSGMDVTPVDVQTGRGTRHVPGLVLSLNKYEISAF